MSRKPGSCRCALPQPHPLVLLIARERVSSLSRALAFTFWPAAGCRCPCRLPLAPCAGIGHYNRSPGVHTRIGIYISITYQCLKLFIVARDRSGPTSSLYVSLSPQSAAHVAAVEGPNQSALSERREENPYLPASEPLQGLLTPRGIRGYKT